MKIRILGCGASSGTPVISGAWGACDPADKRNHRTRCSTAFEVDDQLWVIDVSPDLRTQCLREGIHHIDGVLCTHPHFDHIGGLDELKNIAIAQKKLVPFYSDASTYKALHARCPYAFGTEWPESITAYRPFVHSVLIDGPFSIAHGLKIMPFIQDHRYIHSLGFRFPTWAYSTDVWNLDEAAFSALKGIELWLVDCLGITPQPHWSHAHLEKTLSWIERVKPQRAVLIHMSCQIDYATVTRMLPPHVMLAYDGLCLEST